MLPSLRTAVFVLAGLATSANADYLEELRRGSSGQVTADLVKLAEWCKGRKLYRSRLYYLILEFDNDHALARRKLRFVKGKGGKWVRLRPMPETRDRKPEHQEELAAKRREIAAMYAASLLPLIEKSGATTPGATRERVFHELFLLNPEHARGRAANGETSDGSRWVLKETRTAAARRLVLRTKIRKLLGELPAGKEIEPTKEEKAYGVDWKAALQGTSWRLLFAAEAHEASGCLRIADATEGVFEAVFGMGGVYFSGRRILMTDDDAKYRKILAAAPHMTKKEFERSKGLSSTWLPRSRTCLCSKPYADWRVEICARQPFGLLLDEYFEVSGRHGWVWEGVGLYLTHALTGYRRSTFVRVTRYAEEDRNKREERLWGELLAKTADWFAIATARIERGETPDWNLMLAKDVNQMEVNDLLFSFLLGAYLVEAHADKLPGILKEIGENKASAGVLQAALGMPLSRIEQRIYRWIREHGRG